MITWNKGNSNFSNKRDDICITLDRFNPDIFSIHDANFLVDNDRNFKNYTIEYNTLTENSKIARTITLIKKGISYKRRYDLEDRYISSI